MPNKEPLNILHLEDDVHDAELIAHKLKSSQLNCHISVITSADDFSAALEKGGFDLIISDYSLPSFDGLSALKMAQARHPETPFVFVSGTIGEERAIESLREGATDYILKDRLSRLVPAIQRALAESKAKKEQLRAYLQIREQATLLDQAQDAISVNDLNQVILYWNKSAERLYGWSAKEAIGRCANAILFQEDVTVPIAGFKSLIRTGEWKGELNQITKTGKEIIVESRWTLLRDEQGAPKSILVINTDVTAQKQIEAQLLRTQRMESIGALAGGIAHDFNNALTPVVMALACMKSEPISDDSKRLLTIAQTSIHRSVEMIKQILSFSRGSKGMQSRMELRTLIEEMVQLASDTFPKSIKIEMSISPNLAPVEGNPTQIHQVILNLCVNARDAMPGGGTLLIEATNIKLSENSVRGQNHPAGNYVLLSVLDTGIGMSPDSLKRIFEPFFTTKETGKGTGLGLSTVMGIVKTHNGLVDVTSEVGKGSTFRIYLPEQTVH